MNAEILRKLYEIAHRATHLNLDGIEHEESLVAPEAGNSLNWVLGHMVATRNVVLAALGEGPVWEEGKAQLYSGTAEAGWSPERALPLDSIVADLDRSQERIVSGLERLSDEALEEPSGNGTLGWRLGFLHFHESYHVGQIGLLRRLLGKPGVIKPPKPAESGTSGGA
jgi:uncharacterized damage-inducible protein DinB